MKEGTVRGGGGEGAQSTHPLMVVEISELHVLLKIGKLQGM